MSGDEDGDTKPAYALNVGTSVICNNHVNNISACININDELTVNNVNIDAFHVGGISGNYSTGIYITSGDVNEAISGFNDAGIKIEGDIMV